jgi:hypothetical protein
MAVARTKASKIQCSYAGSLSVVVGFRAQQEGEQAYRRVGRVGGETGVHYKIAEAAGMV